MSYNVAIVLGLIVALGATIYACVAIVPEDKRAGLSQFLQKVHDIFNFKSLILEKIVKVLYIFSTLFCIGAGFFLLFAVIPGWYGSSSTALYGILLLILGPFVMRISYESAMLFILLVKNTMEIRGKLCSTQAAPAAPEAPETPEAPAAPRKVYCSNCGTPYNPDEGGCPNCSGQQQP